MVKFRGLEELEPGKDYYVKWGFKRVGKISKDKFVKRGKTDSITFSPTAGQPSAR